MNVICRVGDAIVEQRSLTRREMNWGQGCVGVAPKSYRLLVHVDEFLVAVRPEFERVCDELSVDQEYDSDCPEAKAMGLLGWPNIEQMFRDDRSLLTVVLKKFLLMEILDILLPYSLNELVVPAYAVDSVSALTIGDSEVSIEGIAYFFDLNRLRQGV